MNELSVVGREIELDIVIPVYDEGENIRHVLDALRAVRTPLRVLICYDSESDNTLTSLRSYRSPFPVEPVRNRGKGVLGAVVTGLRTSDAPAVLVLPADDDYNADRIDAMIGVLRQGNEIVAASRFAAGGRMDGCPMVKAVLVRTAAFILYHIARLPTRDATNGFRLFSRRAIDEIEIESTVGFAYGMELLVKCHRLGWPIAEVPALWRERLRGRSRFRAIRWSPAYLRWFLYALATRFLFRGATSVRLREGTMRGA